jgi:hypothetical protein
MDLRRLIPRAALLIALGGWISSTHAQSDTTPAPLIIKLDRTNDHMMSAADPAATGGQSVAVRVTEANKGETNQWPLTKEPLPPGLYRCTIKARLQLPKDYDVDRLRINFNLESGGTVLASFDLDWGVFDGRAGQFTAFTREFSLTNAVQPVLHLGYHFTSIMDLRGKAHPIQPVRRPTVNDENATPEEDFVNTFNQSLDAETARPVAEIDAPVVFLDTLAIEPVSHTLVIEKVWPEKIHVYPGGETNPITVTVRNYQPQPATATVRLTMHTGLNEVGAPQELPVTVPSNGTATCRFDWHSGAREYGQGACAELIVDGKTVHTLTDYFSVSTPVWKTSIQGSGFLSWAGREGNFPSHVESCRRSYVNVEEAFSWQPSSWTDLNPTTELWTTGQNNFHNSLKGLRLWMSLSHSNGIKLTTYSWPTASGPEGFEWARRHPNLFGSGGPLSADVDAFRLFHLTSARPELKGLEQGNWYSIWVNLGLLRVIDLGATEIINSAKTFGWDGVRFDYPPSDFSSWPAADMHAQMAEMGVTNLMQQLIPEYIGNTTGTWSAAAVTARNFRYLRHRFFTEVSSNFAVSYNYGLPDKDIVGFDPRTNHLTFVEACRQGGQIMDEAIRNSGSWKGYREAALKQAGITRLSGGYHECFPAETSSFPAYSAIFTFAAGSHPYTDYGWSGRPMAGRYAAFMTRYGEYCWDNAFQPIDADAAGVSIDDHDRLLWKPYLRARRTGSGTTQTVVQLISPPLNDEVAPRKVAQSTPWSTGLTVHKRGTALPTVWRLSAEPDVQCEKLAAHPEGDGFTVTVPEHRLWTILVWEENQP